MNLKNFLTTPLQRPLSKGLLIALFVVAALGFADATYLTVEHFLNSIPPCAIGGCETVLTSQYAEVAGIPVALGGSVFYLLILILLKIYFDRKNEKILRFALSITIPAFLATIYFFILQAFVTHAFCVYCLGSAFLALLICIVASLLEPLGRSAVTPPPLPAPES